jgi:L-seryl-tRNA(Ser) seleniumtransferase
MDDLRALPSVDSLLQTQQAAQLIKDYGRPLTLRAIRSALDNIRVDYKPEKTSSLHLVALDLAKDILEGWLESSLYPVINATGVILHTNLGRAPLCRTAVQAIQNLAAGYCSLEFELTTGQRGLRSGHVEKMLKLLTGAEAALIVNNNAAAVVLVLTALAKRKRVVISRTQLVEIGGGFRVPEVMQQSGAKLIEVGTTNQVHLNDYREALEESATVVLHAHSSNFKIIGFTGEPKLSEVADLAHNYQAVMVDDLGSGALLDTARFGLAHEPTVQESIASGCDIVCFSGDKLLGGPQAGVIVGRADLLTKIKKHPMARVLRADKLCLAAMAATLSHYLKDQAAREIPVWQMISKSTRELLNSAERWKQVIGTGTVIPGESTIGGGSLPGEILSTNLLALQVPRPNLFLAKLRNVRPAIIARIFEDQVVLDPRTVLPEQEEALLVGLQNALKDYLN